MSLGNFVDDIGSGNKCQGGQYAPRERGPYIGLQYRKFHWPRLGLHELHGEGKNFVPWYRNCLRRLLEKF